MYNQLLKDDRSVYFEYKLISQMFKLYKRF